MFVEIQSKMALSSVGAILSTHHLYAKMISFGIKFSFLQQLLIRRLNLRPRPEWSSFYFFCFGKVLEKIKKRERRTDKGAQIIIIVESERKNLKLSIYSKILTL